MTSLLSGATLPPVELARPRRVGRAPRLVAYVLTVWFLVSLNFALPRAMPGDPIEAMLSGGESGRAPTAEQRAAAARYYGLDRPLWAQYGHYLGGLVRGDLGFSIRSNRPVRDVVAERLPWSILLGATSVVLGTAIGVMAGAHAGWRRGRWADRALVGVFTATRGIPPFFIASMALSVFAVKLQWLPLFGAKTPFAESSGFLSSAADVARHLLLPASVGTLLFMGSSFLIMRAGMVSELGSDYLLLGRAKGMSEHRLQYAYAARNAMLPLVTLVALELGASMSSGLVFIETVFAYPGVGRLLFDAVATRDYPMLQGAFLVITLGVVSLNYVADVIAARLDPRTAS